MTLDELIPHFYGNTKLSVSELIHKTKEVFRGGPDVSEVLNELVALTTDSLGAETDNYISIILLSNYIHILVGISNERSENHELVCLENDEDYEELDLYITDEDIKFSYSLTMELSDRLNTKFKSINDEQFR